jgi:hypothetical protein
LICCVSIVVPLLKKSPAWHRGAQVATIVSFGTM